MSDRANLVRVLTTSTGTSTMTLGTAYSQLFMTPAEANMVDGRTYTYIIVDGNNWELGKGVYTASGTTLSRVTVLQSRISGTLGTTKVTLSGTAQVRIIESADDMGALRGTRAVTGTTDTLAQNDLGRAVTYSNAASIAVSLAQAGASSQFLDGWSTWVQNIGAGTVTITPATSTINAAATLVLAQNLGAFIWSDGTNYHAYIIPITKPLLAASNLSDVANAGTARNNLGIPAIMRSYLAGLTLSTAGSSSTFGVAAGVATETAGTDTMTLASAYTKTTSAWAVGSGNGSLDTGTIANNTWYHVFQIKRIDTGVVDVLLSTSNGSSSSPVFPTNYTLARRLGAMKTNGSGQWIKFVQDGDMFQWDSPVPDVAAANPGTSAVARTLSTPLGIRVLASLVAGLAAQNGAASLAAYLSDLSVSDQAAIQTGAVTIMQYNSVGGTTVTAGMLPVSVMTNIASQIRSRLQSSTADVTLYITTLGWIDRRGRDA